MKIPEILVLALALTLAACATPSESFTARAKRSGLEPQIAVGELFQHKIYWNAGARRLTESRDDAAERRQGPRVLHIYIGGDGVPWRAGNPTSDPTARNPLMLRLISLDKEPAVFVGRPCFHGLAETPPCTWQYWNDARYSEPVVASMAAAIDHIREETGADELILFGGSGGGAIAVLVSDRIEGVTGIITVAANLDTRAWLSYHAYDGLRESLNPALDGRKDKARNAAIFERHFAGGKDKTVPAETVTGGVRAAGELIVIPEYDHNCCWHEIWPDVLAQLDAFEARVPAASSVAVPPRP